MKTIRVAAAMIIEDGAVLATQRGYGAFKGGWEFPGGKLEPGELPEETLVREIREELEADIEVVEYLDTVEYDYPEFHLSMACFVCRLKSGELVLKEHEAARWLSKEMLRSVEWLPADVEVLEKVEKKL